MGCDQTVGILPCGRGTVLFGKIKNSGDVDMCLDIIIIIFMLGPHTFSVYV